MKKLFLFIFVCLLMAFSVFAANPSQQTVTISNGTVSLVGSDTGATGFQLIIGDMPVYINGISVLSGTVACTKAYINGVAADSGLTWTTPLLLQNKTTYDLTCDNNGFNYNRRYGEGTNGSRNNLSSLINVSVGSSIYCPAFSCNIANIYLTPLNTSAIVRVYDFSTGATLPFNATINGTTFLNNNILFINNLSANNAAIPINLTANGYIIQREYIESGLYNNITAYFPNSININLVDEVTNSIITTTNITSQLITEGYSYSNSTTTGTSIVYLIQPSNYTVRTSATGFATRFNYIILTNNSFNITTIYMANLSKGFSNITVTVYDQSQMPLENAIVYVLRYDISLNGYKNVETTITSPLGVGFFSGQLFTEYYKFIVEYPSGTIVYTSNPFYLTSTTVPLTVNSLTSTQNGWQLSQGISSTTTFINASSAFSFSWTDSGLVASNYCLKIYNTAGNLINSSCSTSSTGQILIQINQSNYAYLIGKGTVTIQGHDYVISSYAWEQTSTNLGVVMIFLDAALTIIIVFMFRSDPILAVSSVPIATTIMTLLGLLSIGLWIPVVMWIMCISVAFMMRYS